MKAQLSKSLALIHVFVLVSCSIPFVTRPTEVPATATPRSYPTPLADATILLQDSRPNIIFLLVDDLDARLGTINYMPILQKLMISEGLSLNDFLITNSICCPSRATFLRGQYTHCHEVYMNQPPEGGFQKFFNLGRESSTIGTWLQAAGYQTVFLGKYLNGYPFRNDREYVPPGWTEWYSPAKGKPYVGLDYELNENGTLVPYDPRPENYLMDVLSQKTVDFIRQAQNTSSPFFIYLAPYQPHEPAIPADRHKDMYLDEKIPRTPAFNEADVSDKVGGIRFDPLLSEQTIQDLDAYYVQRIQSMQSVDEMIKAVIDALTETGQMDNTYIIFTSDNGYHIGQHRLKAGKGTAFEEDIVVPFVIRGPGIAKGEILDGYLTGNIDFAPTIADLAGIIPPDFVNGRSMTPLWSDQLVAPDSWRKAYLLEFYGFKMEEESSSAQLVGYNYNLPSDSGVLEPPDVDQYEDNVFPPVFLGLRTSQYLYLEHQGGERELYDLISDPYQLENIADTTDPVLIQDLSNWLAALSICEGNSCIAIEDGQYP